MNLRFELQKADKAVADVTAIRDRIADAINNTHSILDAAKALGVKRVGVGARDKTLKDSDGHPFQVDGNIFADGRRGGWPVAWAITENSVGSLCGNRGQSQISVPIVNGIYELKNGRWLRKE